MAEALSPLIAPVNDLDREAADLQERARLLHEEIDTLITSATNRSMRALTVISTLLIPPTVVVGAFGMNLPGMPFANSRGGFALATGLCLAVVAAAWALLRRLRVLP
jgi:zinc transporter